MVFHVLNRGVGRQQLFGKDADYAAFEAVIEETLEKCPMRICGYCLMPNHWHFVLWPKGDGDLAAFMQRLTVTHVTRWQRHRHVIGEGHVYQGRFKSFPVETEEYYHQLMRYVERNALRANLVESAEQWRWSSLWRREHGTPEHPQLLSPGPLPLPSGWVDVVNRPQTEGEVEAIRRSIRRGTPLGSESWIKRIVKRLGLESTCAPAAAPDSQKPAKNQDDTSKPPINGPVPFSPPGSHFGKGDSGLVPRAGIDGRDGRGVPVGVVGREDVDIGIVGGGAVVAAGTPFQIAHCVRGFS
jgi:putative transposase